MASSSEYHYRVGIVQIFAVHEPKLNIDLHSSVLRLLDKSLHRQPW